MTAKEKLQQVVEELSEGEAAAALELLRRDSDPILSFFEKAPPDDEPVDAEEDGKIEEAWADHRAGNSLPLDQVRRELA